MTDEQIDLTSLTVDLLAAFVSHNNVRPDDLADLIGTTHAALASLSTPAAPSTEQIAPEPEYKAAVSVRKSLSSPDHIVSMIDGKPYRSLKRHLSAKGLTMDQYRSRYNLPENYPSVAPSYSEARREVAKRLGLGRRSKSGAQAAEAPVETAPAKPARGRRRAAAAGE